MTDDLHGALLHYQLYNVTNDPYDMELRNVDSLAQSYRLHITRKEETNPAHMTLHRGTSVDDPIDAVGVFETNTTGQIIIGDPCGAAKGTSTVKWKQPEISYFTDFEATSETTPKRMLRWYKTYRKRPRPMRIHGQGFIEWTLHDVTGLGAKETATSTPAGEMIATLVLEVPDEALRRRFIQASRPGGETGNLVWHERPDDYTRTLAHMVILTLWHKDRQTFYAAPLGPGLDIRNPGRTAAVLPNMYGAAWAWVTIS